MDVLGELGLSVSMTDQIPLYDDDLQITLGNSGNYLFEVIVEKEDVKKLSILLKGYEKQFPKRAKPLIREKALEGIALKMGELDTGEGLVKFLKECGVDKELIVYPNTKWRMIFDAMSYLSYSDKREDQEALSRIIGEATHPLMHNGNVSSAEALRSEFNNYLSYDKIGIAYKEDDGTYWALSKANNDEIQTAAFDLEMELEEEEKQQLEFLRQPKNKEKVSLLKKIYQSLMNVVETFCENPSKPTSELNNAYNFLDHLVWEIIGDLKLRGNTIRNFNHYTSPFVNLFAAEKHYREQKRELSWQKIRPEMNAMYGDIEELYRAVNGSDILAEPDQQKKINDIQFYLSKLKEKSKEIKTEINKKLSNNFRKKKQEPLHIVIDGAKKIEDKLEAIATKNEKTTTIKGKKYPQSIHLISASLEPQDAIWLVFEERFEMPKRFAVWNKIGEITAVKKLYDIAYEWDVPNKMINYNERVADNINNGLFKNRWVAKYMKTNKLEKPTLVQKSEKGTLVLKNEIPVKTGLIKNVVPLQYQSLYTDKTK